MSDSYGNRYTYFSTNYSKFNDPKFISRIVDQVQKKSQKYNLTPSELTMITDFFKNLDPRIFVNKTEDTIIKAISDMLVKKIKEQPCVPNDNVDIHEILKAQIGSSNVVDTSSIDQLEGGASTQNAINQISTTFQGNSVQITSLLGISSISGIQQLLSSPVTTKFAYLNFDTRYRSLNNDGTQFVRWNFINDELFQQGTVNAIGNIQNVVAMRVYPIRLPYISSADNNYGRISMFIQEFSAQSFIGIEARYHFMFKPNIINNYIELTTDQFNDGYYRFRTPISTLNSFTFSFGSPFEPIRFDSDRDTATILSYGNSTIFRLSSPQNLATGDIVYTTGFRTLSPQIDINVISAINNPNGNVITVIDSNTFSIPVNSTLISQNGNGTISVTNGSDIVTGTDSTFFAEVDATNTISFNGVTYTVLSVLSDTSLLLTVPYVGANLSGLVYYINVQGTVSATNGSPNIVGTGTNFTQVFARNDFISINGINYLIDRVVSATQITLATNYNEITAATLSYGRNNIQNGLVVQNYFGSKRFIVQIEFEYLSSLI